MFFWSCVSFTFFYHLLSFLKKNDTFVESINCVDVDGASIKALLSTMSFSGVTTYYLEHFSTLSVKKQQELFEYVRSYTGPHRIMLFSENAAMESLVAGTAINSITVPEEIAPRDFLLVRCLFNDTPQEKSAFASELIMRTDHLSLDSACLFAHYEILLGKGVEDFFSQWMTYLVDPTTSLFTLSQHFFSKKPKLFFRQWAAISELYLPPFWASYWADQVWRAYVFCDVMKQKKHAEAKKVQYKLPFSFINRDWSSYSLDELRNAHHCLATLDFQLKNGACDIGLEYFYTQFFDNKFLVK